MDTPFGPIDPNAFADTPLFREIQRVLSSSSGPVNWELARQIGIAGAQEGREDPAPTDADHHGFEEAVRLAELHVARFTGLEPPADLAPVEVVRLAEWVSATLDELKDLLEPAAAKLTSAMGELSLADLSPEASELPPEIADQMGQMGGFLQQLSPLMMGAQVGTVLGYLGQQVFGRYDIAVPRRGADRLRFVVSNVARFEKAWSLDPTEFRTFVALHEVAHRFEFARSWTAPRFGELLEDFHSTLSIDPTAIREKLAAIDTSDPEAMRSLMESDEGLFGGELDDEQRIKLARVQSFMAAAEGYGDHVAHAIAAELLPSFTRIREAMGRHREDEHADAVFERLLGIEMKREQYAQGRAFCDAVVEATDEVTLARMWESPEALPSLPEVEEPLLWLARTV